jgi:hypothetical protein
MNFFNIKNVIVFLTLYCSCQHVTSPDDSNKEFGFYLTSNYTMGNDTLNSYLWSFNDAARNYTPVLIQQKHQIQLVLSSFRTHTIVLDTTLQLDSNHFTFPLPPQIVNDTLYYQVRFITFRNHQLPKSSILYL